jgi:hypothetical protein
MQQRPRGYLFSIVIKRGRLDAPKLWLPVRSPLDAASAFQVKREARALKWCLGRRMRHYVLIESSGNEHATAATTLSTAEYGQRNACERRKRA